MHLQMILFDLDGTLLPMDQDAFTRRYFELLAAKLAPRGYDPRKLIECVWSGTRAMVKNDGSCTNEQAFWNHFAGLLGEQVRQDLPIFDAFYRSEFSGARSACGFNPAAAETIAAIRRLGLRTALATNPLFPAVATDARIAWAGLNREDFELITTYENSTHCKPNPEYYRDILAALHIAPEACLMVGNDVDEDMIAARATGMNVFLLEDCLLIRRDADISIYPRGSFSELMNYIQDRI